MKLAVIKYNAGNVRSLQYALGRLGIDALVTDDIEEILGADKIIFPGVGEASSAMQYLKQKNLDKIILQATQPFLGICLGMQLMCAHSEENNTECLGVFNQQVKLFKSDDPSLKVPQIGWNRISELKSDLFSGVQSDSYCYFVHSYYAEVGCDTIATTDYCNVFSSALHKNNFYGVQFHPEKSADIGQLILQNFLTIK
jgi:glutamine amidotransferase